MDIIKINAPAKINLALDVIRKREDGYHDVKMIMQSIRLYDRLIVRKNHHHQIRLASNLSYLPCDENNLVYKAIQLIKDEFNIDTGVSVRLEKHIPVAAGMAGGSSDCAAALIAMNQLFHLKLSDEELKIRGVKLGADVPYCIMKGTALSEGIGDILTPLPNTPDCYVLIAKPNTHVSTKTVYTNLKLDNETAHPDIDEVISQINSGDLQKMCEHMGNILETVTIPLHPEIGELKKIMMENGSLGSLMSGSGPTVFGIFDNEKDAKIARNKCKDHNRSNFVFLTQLYR